MGRAGQVGLVGQEPLAAYRSALDSALAKYPQDDELWLLRGMAESPNPAERGQGSVAGSIRFYEKAKAMAPAHFAAYHYLTHAYENAGRVSEALAAGAVYATMAPGVPHARHMHGHDLRRVGRIDEAIEEFVRPTPPERLRKAEQIPVEYDWNYQHNIDLLATSYQYAGQMANAEPLFENRSRSHPLDRAGAQQREWPVFLRGRGRVRRSAAAATVLAGHRSPLISAMGHVEAGRALLRQGKFQAATGEANTALRLIRGVEGGGLVATPLQNPSGGISSCDRSNDKARPMLQDVGEKGPPGARFPMPGRRRFSRSRRCPGPPRRGGLGTRRLGGASDGRARHELRRRAPGARPCARHAGEEKTAHADSLWPQNTGRKPIPI